MTARKPIRYAVPYRPLILSINDVAGSDVQRALINILPYKILDSRTGRRCVVPSLFISDGMSQPDVAQVDLQSDEGDAAGHTHDWVFSREAQRLGFDAFSEAALLPEAERDDAARAVADQILRDYLDGYCPGYDRWGKDWRAYAGVRIGGASSFRDPSRDEWRKAVADRLGGLPGNGCGHEVRFAPALQDSVKYLRQFGVRL